ncbi:MAG TPA: homoserine dehydrogenase [Terriglobales bacterium]|nr:homoserine dehydrogenase [Terriglobales bacterium]
MNRALVRLLQEKTPELQKRNIGWRITGVATRSMGWIANAGGFDPSALLKDKAVGTLKSTPQSVREWLRATQADVLFEATSLNIQDGQPAIDHLRAALEAGSHAITANKGPIVHAYQEIRALADSKGLSFLFESTVMDGAPIFSMFRDSLPALHLWGFRGILNSTTNVILGGMEEGMSFEESLKKAQKIGVAETDPTYDIEGWDAAVKVAVLITVVMGEKIALDAIQREGIRGLSGETVRAARALGKPYKLVCRAQRDENGIHASVRPEQVPLSDPLAWIAGTSNCVYFETDMFPGLAITEINPGPIATAYGMLADFIRAVSN